MCLNYLRYTIYCGYSEGCCDYKKESPNISVEAFIHGGLGALNSGYTDYESCETNKQPRQQKIKKGHKPKFVAFLNLSISY